jgi:hypothetical protein
LNVEVDAVLHPASESAQQAALEQKGKAVRAWADEQKKDEELRQRLSFRKVFLLLILLSVPIGLFATGSFWLIRSRAPTLPHAETKSESTPAPAATPGPLAPSQYSRGSPASIAGSFRLSASDSYYILPFYKQNGHKGVVDCTAQYSSSFTNGLFVIFNAKPDDFARIYFSREQRSPVAILKVTLPANNLSPLLTPPEPPGQLPADPSPYQKARFYLEDVPSIPKGASTSVQCYVIIDAEATNRP